MSNQKGSSSTVSKIYKSRVNLLNILGSRGYNVADYNNFGINEIQIMLNKSQLDMLLEKEDGTKIYVKYHITGKLRENHINDYIDDLFNIEEVLGKNDELLILIKDQNINKTLTDFINFVFVKDEYYVNINQIKNYMFNILEHSLVPRHRILSNEEKDSIKKKYYIVNESEFPEISRFDPVAIAIGLRPNQLCEILRSSKTSITTFYYRLCH